MKKIILTGATGYIGRLAIAPLIERDYIVHAVTSKGAGEDLPNLVWHQADLLDKGAVDSLIAEIRPTHLLHFAWYVEHGKFWNAPENADWLEASIYMAERFGTHGGQRFVYAGTCAEYDWKAASPFSEHETPLLPQTRYGKTKRELGIELETLAAKLSFSFASGRIFFPFGGGEPPNRLVPSVIRAVLQDREAKTSHGEQIRDFLYVEDTAEAFAALLDSEVRGPVNIGSGKGTKIKDVVTAIGEITGKSELLRIGSLAAPENDPEAIVADVTRLRDEVKFESSTDLTTGLIRTIDWWKKHL
jgi:nucleoside-diphosphate-sugar epimerase